MLMFTPDGTPLIVYVYLTIKHMLALNIFLFVADKVYLCSFSLVLQHGGPRAFFITKLSISKTRLKYWAPNT